MADRYFKGGNWSDINNWSTTVNGSGGASLPFSSSNVYWSSAPNSASCIIDASAVSLIFDFSGATNSPTFGGTFGLNVYGLLNLCGISSWSNSGTLNLKSSGVCNITTNNLDLSSLVGLTISGSGTFSMQDDINIGAGSLTQTGGIFYTNDHAITCGSWNGGSAVTRAMHLGTSIITCSGNVAFNGTTNLTFDCGNSKIIMTGATKTFTGGYNTWYDLDFQGTPISMIGSNTFHNITGHAGNTIKFATSETQTLTGTFDGAGTPGHLITLITTLNSGAPFILSKSSGIVTADYYSIKDSTATGGATWNAAHSTLVSGNTGWNLLVPATIIDASTGTVAVNGVNASITTGRTIQAAKGAITVTGINATLRVDKIIQASKGAIAVTGINASVTTGRNIQTSTGEVSIAGIDASITTGRTIQTSKGTIIVTGINATVSVDKIIQASESNVDVKGSDYIVDTTSNVIIIPSTGHITISGINAIVSVPVLINTSEGALSILGINASVTTGRTVRTSTGIMNIVGIDATIEAGSPGYDIDTDSFKLESNGQFTAKLINLSDITNISNVGSSDWLNDSDISRANKVIVYYTANESHDVVPYYDDTNTGSKNRINVKNNKLNDLSGTSRKILLDNFCEENLKIDFVNKSEDILDITNIKVKLQF